MKHIKKLISFLILIVTMSSFSASVIDVDKYQEGSGTDVTSLTSYPLFKNQESIYKVTVDLNQKQIYKLNYDNYFAFDNTQIKINKDEPIKKDINWFLVLVIIIIIFLVIYFTNAYYIYRRRKNDYKSQYKY